MRRFALVCALVAYATTATATSLTSIVPASAPHGARAVIVGSGLDAPGIAVSFASASGSAAAALISQSASLLEIAVPSTATSGPVTVSSSAGAIGTLPFTLAPDPVASTVVTLAGSPGNTFAFPSGVASAPNGNIFVADTAHNQIQIVTAAGVASVFAGSGQAGSADGSAAAAQFRGPTGIAYDAVRQIVYVADTGNNKIRAIAADGTVSTFAGSGLLGHTDGSGTAATFAAPSGLTVDVSGNLYVCDSLNFKIRMITPSAAVTTFAGSGFPGFADGSASQARLAGPVGIAIDSVGTLYVADTPNQAIRKIAGGTVSTIVRGSAQLPSPVGVAVASDGTLYVADTFFNRIAKVAGGTATSFAGSTAGFADGALASAKFNDPTGIAIGDSMVIADTRNNAIRLLLPGVTLNDAYPTRGPLAGGGSVRIFGSGLRPGATVQFGSVAATSVVFVTSTELLAVVPTASAGMVDIVVTSGGNTATLSGKYTYEAAPSISGVAPLEGPIAGGTSIVISGANFVAGDVSVTVGGVPASITSVTSTAVTAVTPAGASGAVPITVTTSGGQTSFSGFTYFAPPVISSFAPSSALPGATVTITGQNFDPNPAGDVLTLGTTPIPIATASAAQLTLAIPQNATSGTFTLTTAGGTTQSATPFTVIPPEPIPPDPASVAPPIDPTKITTVYDSTSFLYTGSNPIQVGMVPGTIEFVRAAVVRGKVFDSTGQPLSAVHVTILNHPEYGHTLSRLDGGYDLAVNGGGQLTLQYQKDGYITAQRQVTPSWNSFAIVDDLQLSPYDTAATVVDLTSSAMQVARGTTSSDADGTRTATLLFQPGTQATMTMPDGSTQPMSKLTVRATELTVGPDGPKRMPAQLPPTSGYTYCVDLSADEATAAGAKSLTFSQPAVFYVDNFLNFPNGTHVPVGYYDPARGIWIPADNGKVITVVSITQGIAYLDVNGDGLADDPATLAQLGITDAERQTLAQYYSAGQSLWRIPVSHFSVWDANFPYGPVPGSGVPPAPRATSVSSPPRDLCTECTGASTISVESQSLGEDVPVTGTGLSLHYQSSRLRQVGPNQVQIVITGPNDAMPGNPEVDATINVAGQITVLSGTGHPNMSFLYTWNGLDAYGRPVQGPVVVHVSTKVTYKAVYQVPNVPPSQIHFPSPLFGTLSGIAAFDTSRLTYSFTSSASTTLFATTVGQWNPVSIGLGGWTLSANHFYDYQSGTLYMGDGEQNQLQGLGPVITTVAGGGNQNDPLNGDGGPATQAYLIAANSVAFGPDSTLYLADEASIRRVDRSGIITTIAGGGNDSSDGIAATQAQICPNRLAIAPDGTIYFTETCGFGTTPTAPLRAIRDGIVSTVNLSDSAGNAITPYGIAVDAQSNLYVANGQAVYKFTPDGVLNDTFGSGQYGSGGDGGAASAAALINPTEVAVRADGTVFISSPDANNIRYVTSDGIIHTFVSGVDTTFGSGGPIETVNGLAVDSTNVYASTDVIHPDGTRAPFVGAGGSPQNGDGGPALEATLGQPTDLAIGPDGAIYIADNNSPPPNTGARIRRVGRPMPGLTAGELAVASRDGSEYYTFDGTGRHLRTVDALTGVTRLQFGYDAKGYLISVTDADGNVVTIERDDLEVPIAIDAPGGQRTTLAVNGYLSQVTNPAGEAYQFAYTIPEFGLMTSMTDPKGQVHTFAYDASGLLTFDSDPAGGSTTLSRVGGDTDYTVTRLTAEGRQSSYRIQTADDRSFVETVTDAAANVTTRNTGANGSESTAAPDGSQSAATLTADPRFGMQASFAQQASFSTPGGISLSLTGSRSVTLPSPGSLLVQTATSSTSINGRTFTSAFDAASNTITDTSAESRQRTSVLDAKGKLASMSIGGITPWSFAYDTRGRLTTITQGTRTATFAYDTLNRLTSITDPLSRTVQFGYDNADRVTQQTLPDGRVIGFAYDKNGNLTAVTPPSRPAHLFAYTPVDLTQSYTPPSVSNGGATQYAYNRDRQLTSITRPDGKAVTLGYDPAGRLGTLTIARGAYTFSYDSAGRLGSITAPSGDSIGYQYDGPLPIHTQWNGAVSGAIDWTYDNDLALSTEAVSCATATNAACQPVSFSYDQDKLLTGAGAESIARDPNNGLVTSTAAGSVSDAWTYNAFGEPASYTASWSATPLMSEQWTRDGAGRITQKSETIGGVTSIYTYGYDTAGRLTAVTTNGTVSASYTYDENSNRLTKNSEVGTYDAQDRMLTYNGASYSYTANGELQSKSDSTGTTTYNYDELGNLLSVTKPDGTLIEYVIDAQNRRVGKKVNGTLVMELVYSDGLRPAAEMDGNGNVVERYIYGSRTNAPDLIVKGDVTYRVLSDHLGSPRLIVNTADGTIAERMDYDEFGIVLSDTNPGFQPFGFAGGLYDADTKLVRFGTRDYDPSTGRWTSKEPLRFPSGGTNAFEYAASDPEQLFDQTGAAWSIGGSVSEATEFGVPGYGMLGQQGSLALGFFFPHSIDPEEMATFASWGGFSGVYHRPDLSHSYPQDPRCENISWGAYGGLGTNLWLSNASSSHDLTGVFRVRSFNLGAITRTFSIQYASGTNAAGEYIWVVSYGGTPLPGVAFGVSASSYNTNTWPGGH